MSVAYWIWGPSWTSVLVLGGVGIVLSQVSHATDWRQSFMTAGTICLAVAAAGAALLLIRLYMG